MSILNLTGADTAQQGEQTPPDVTNVADAVVHDGTQVDNQNQGDAKEKVVVLDGPLSQIYTQALNLAYAKEDTGTMASVMKLMHAGGALPVQAAFVDDKGAYVYAVDDKSLDDQGLVVTLETIRQAVKSEKYSHVILAMEASNVNAKMQLLDEASRQMGVTVCLTRSKATQTVLSALKK